MAKFKTDPDQGTRKLILPFVGEVQITDGEVEIPDEFVDDLLLAEVGIKFIKEGETKKKEPVKPEKEQEQGENAQISRESLEKMKASEIKNIANELVEGNLMTKEELESVKNKTELVDLICLKLAL